MNFMKKFIAGVVAKQTNLLGLESQLKKRRREVCSCCHKWMKFIAVIQCQLRLIMILGWYSNIWTTGNSIGNHWCVAFSTFFFILILVSYYLLLNMCFGKFCFWWFTLWFTMTWCTRQVKARRISTSGCQNRAHGLVVQVQVTSWGWSVESR